MLSDLKVCQDSRYVGDKTWEWAVWLEGSQEQLDAIENVVYTLHRSFPNPVRTITDRSTGFRIESSGWGTFTIYVEVIRKDGDRIALEHELELNYPEEQRAILPESAENHLLARRIQSPGPKRLLSIDAGGTRTIVAIEVLSEIEALLRQQLGKGSSFVLADYFDYVAGTSSGAFVAACISQGMSVDQLRRAFMGSVHTMFDRAQLLKRFHYKYQAEPYAVTLRDIFGRDNTLASDRLRTLILIVLRNETADSPWFVTNNPFAKYNSRDRLWSELQLHLWQVIRASSAAPVYFPPELISLGGQEALFVDGTLTGFGNPSFQLFLRATAEPYGVNWPVGEDKLLLVSVGTGTWQDRKPDLTPSDMSIMYSASAMPSALLSAVQLEQDLLCRMFGKCLVGPALDREVGDMVGMRGPVSPKLFTYLRYNVELTRHGLDQLGLGDVQPEDVRTFDRAESLLELQRVGRALGQRVAAEHFTGFRGSGAGHAVGERSDQHHPDQGSVND